jgi:hypothetical protein
LILSCANAGACATRPAITTAILAVNFSFPGSRRDKLSPARTHTRNKNQRDCADNTRRHLFV